jgi:uncharacterized spore protein YtfJ
MTSQDTFIDRLAQRLSGTAHAATIFGTPVERGDVTLIPVAKPHTDSAVGAGRRTATKAPGAAGVSESRPSATSRCDRAPWCTDRSATGPC